MLNWLNSPHTVLEGLYTHPTQSWRACTLTPHSPGGPLHSPHTVLKGLYAHPTQSWRDCTLTPHSPGGPLRSPHTVLEGLYTHPTQSWRASTLTPHSPGGPLHSPLVWILKLIFLSEGWGTLYPQKVTWGLQEWHTEEDKEDTVQLKEETLNI